MTYGHIVSAFRAASLIAFAVIAISNLPASASDALTASLVALAVPFVLIGTGLVGLIWDRWLTR